MEVEFTLRQVLFSIALISGFGLVARVYTVVVAEPERRRSALKKQGISGPTPTIILGNILEMKKCMDAKVTPTQGPPLDHNAGSFLVPFLEPWRNQYGGVFMFSLGTKQILHVSEPNMVREITTHTSFDLGKPSYQAQEMGALLGQGIITANGPIWAHQRKIIAPHFYMNRVKGMINVIQESAMTLISSWKDTIQKEGGIADIKIDEYMKVFSGSVVSGASFGSNYAKGEQIFKKIGILQKILSKSTHGIGIPGMRWLPTKSNRDLWALEKETRAEILKILKEGGEKSNLLQMLLQSAKNSDMTRDAIDRFIVDNCKNIYFAAYETTSVTATWCLMLLAANPDCQHRIRAEVVQICDGQIPDADMIPQMKQLSMVINETLRLYPPALVVAREALSETTLGNINIPKGVNIWIPVTTLHTDPEIWGPDSYEFNPERFANGITSACKFPHCYMPFGFGQRNCIGQNMALMEIKILICLILCNFSFSISPKYIHSPSIDLATAPGYGVNLLVKSL